MLPFCTSGNGLVQALSCWPEWITNSRNGCANNFNRFSILT